MSESTNLWPLRSVALVIAVLTWLFASYFPKVEELTEQTLEIELEDVALSYPTLQEGLVYRNRPSTVSMRLRGRSQIVQALSSDNVSVTVPMPNEVTSGEPIAVELGSADAIVPEGVQVISFSPSSLSVIAEDLLQVQMAVQPNLRGEPGAGVTLQDVRTVVRPESVTVSGPRSALATLSVLATEPIDLNGRALDFTGQYDVDLSNHPELTAQPQIVTVEVKIESEAPPSDAATVGGTDEPLP